MPGGSLMLEPVKKVTGGRAVTNGAFQFSGGCNPSREHVVKYGTHQCDATIWKDIRKSEGS